MHRITLLEAASIAAGASGKAGGLLGLWAYPECLVPLSYRLHRELAEEHGGAERWGYRRLTCGRIGAIVKPDDLERLGSQTENGIITALRSVTSTEKSESGDSKDWEKLPKQDNKAARLLKNSPLPDELDWVNSEMIQWYEEMGEPGFTETAQVHPFYFTNALANLAKEKGVDIRIGVKVTKINQSKTAVRSIEYENRETSTNHTIDDVTDVVVTAGPWTGKLLPRSRVEGLRAHSVVYDADVSPYAVFTDIQLPTDYVPEHRARMGQKRKHRGNVDPEIYARPGSEVYACGKVSLPSASLPP